MDGHPGNRAGGMVGNEAPSRAMTVVRARLAGTIQLLSGTRKWSELATRFIARDQVHQDNSLTWLDRYPALFDAARMLLSDRPAARILSYGCSSGEEAITLRRYFPDATIVGVEINRHLLKICRQLPSDAGMHFAPPTGDAVRAHGPYDAIFCMAVLTRRPHEIDQRQMRDISHHYPFKAFEREVRHLASLLAPGGLLVVEHALYRVEDAIKGLALAAVSQGLAPAKGPRFDPKGMLIEPQPVIARIFRKGAA